MASSWASVHDDAHLNAALMQQFLDISVTQSKAVVEPKGVLDAAERKAVRLAQANPFWPRRGVGRACGQSRTIRLLRLNCQNPVRYAVCKVVLP